MASPKLSIPEQYMQDVLSGTVSACIWVRKAIERHELDLRKYKEDRSYEYIFDVEEGQAVIDFFGFLHHSKGEWSGSSFELSGWQQFVLYMLFGWRRRSDGFRRFRTCYLEVPRKNGKTTLAAGLGLYLLDGDNEPGAEVYAAATKLDQAKICHNEATNMVKKSRLLRDHIGIYRGNLHNEDTNSKFEPLGRDSDSLDGLNIHGAIIDELHVHKTRDMWDVIDTATGSRRQPLIFCITTAGFDRQSICWENHEYTEKVLDGIIEDDTWFGIIYTVDEGDNWKEEDTWIKANPNYGISVYPHDLKRKAKKAVEMPSAQNAFLRKHLDIWTQSETVWLTNDIWKQNINEFDLDTLKGRVCYGGLDLSSNIDLTAWVMVFEPFFSGDTYKVLCRFFLPEDNMHERVRRDRVNYDVWAQEDYIKLTPGNRIDLDYVIDQIDKDADVYDIQEIAYDRWGANQAVKLLEELGFNEFDENKYMPRTLIRFGQGFASMSPPAKELERLVLGKDIAHNGNPVLSWMISNTVVSEDPAGNIKPNKAKSRERIDGVVAMLMGLDRCVRHYNDNSPYDDRGVLVVTV